MRADEAAPTTSPSDDGAVHRPPGALQDVRERKLKDVSGLMSLPEARDDGPWLMRLNYMAPEQSYRFSDAIRSARADGRLAIVADLARRTGADGPELRPAGSDLAAEARALHALGVCAFVASVDSGLHGASPYDLDELTRALDGPDSSTRARAPPVAADESVLHPLQAAQLVECGASAVVLVASLVGPELEDLLNTCTVIGAEALVEVHTTDELLLALESGATAVLVNRRSRGTGALDDSAALRLGALIPGHVLSLATGGYGAQTSESEFEQLLQAGYDGVLLGAALVAAPPTARQQAAEGGAVTDPAAVIQCALSPVLEQRAISWGTYGGEG